MLVTFHASKIHLKIECDRCRLIKCDQDWLQDMYMIFIHKYFNEEDNNK